MTLRGVILAGGKGTRLGELTKVTNKHLLPVGPYPMVYHPLKKLVGAGIREVMLVSGTEHMGDFVELLGSGKDYGCRLTYRVQDEAGGKIDEHEREDDRHDQHHLGLARVGGRRDRVERLSGEPLERRTGKGRAACCSPPCRTGRPAPPPARAPPAPERKSSANWSRSA